MAKKVVATLKTTSGKQYAKVIRMKRADNSTAYSFDEVIIPNDRVQEYLAKK